MMHLRFDKKKMLSVLFVITVASAGCDKKNSDSQQQSDGTVKVNCSNSSVTNNIRSKLHQKLRDDVDLHLNESLNAYKKMAGGEVDSIQIDYDKQLAQQYLSKTRFDLESIASTKDLDNPNQLICRTTLNISLPEAVVSRADMNSKKQMHFDNCKREFCQGSASVAAYFKKLKDVDVLSANIIQQPVKFSLFKTDQAGLNHDFPNDLDSVDAVANVIVAALLAPVSQFEIKTLSEDETGQAQQQLDLVTEAMQLRLKSLTKQQSQLTQKLNEAWDALNVKDKQMQLDTHRDWFKRRDVECQIQSEKAYQQIPTDQREQYDLGYDHWNNQMKSLDKKIRFLKCSNDRTESRIYDIKSSS